MPYEANTGLGVSNQYGPRSTGDAIGVEHSQTAVQVLKIQFTGESLNSAFLPDVVVPKGALFLRYRLRVDEAFAITTSGTVTFGGTVPGTNGVVLTEAELEAVGTKTPASGGAGTWSLTSATGTTAAQAVARAISGTVTATQGKATLFAEYLMTTKV
jgi:hypothetical protein